MRRSPRHLITLTVMAAAGLTGAAGAQAVNVNPDSRASVRKAYNTAVNRGLRVKPTWTGRTRGCRLGAESAASRAATLNAVNFMRAMNRLQPVTLNADWSRNALASALIMSANRQLSHYPSRRWKCFTPPGGEAAANSNLSLGPSTGTGHVLNYMRDDGWNNMAVGHRRWLLYPPLIAIGTGTTIDANAIDVISAERDFYRNIEPPPPPPPPPMIPVIDLMTGQPVIDPQTGQPMMTPDPNVPQPEPVEWVPPRPPRPTVDVVAWPPAGQVPWQLIPNRFSVSSNLHPDADYSKARMTVTANGRRVPVRVHPPATSTGDNTIVGEVRLPAQMRLRARDTRLVTTVTGAVDATGAPLTFRVTTIAFRHGEPTINPFR